MRILIILLLINAACNNTKIIEQPIVFDEIRKELSLKYIKTHYDIETEEPIIEPKIIVIHWTEIPTLEESFQAFNSPLLPNSRNNIKSASVLNVSAHFLVDRDGTIYQLLPETTFARHVIGLNFNSIGIENVANDNDLPLTNEQFHANLYLINYLLSKYEIEYLIGHDQYQRFIGHNLWLELDSSYLTEKIDVGDQFINNLHKKINPPLKRAPGL